MKLITITLASAVVLLLQVGMPLAQEEAEGAEVVTDTNTTADNPAAWGYRHCQRRCPRWFYFDDDKCKCISRKKVDSVCPDGFDEATVGKGYCVCTKKETPSCPEDWTPNLRTCTCSFKDEPSCPADTKIKIFGGTDKCVGWKQQTCPDLFELLRYPCRCEASVARMCKKDGLEISENGCSCKLQKDPECKGRGCKWNRKTCSCEKRRYGPYDGRRRDPHDDKHRDPYDDKHRNPYDDKHRDPYTCYKYKWCRGHSSTVYSESECCYGNGQSYRYGKQCHHCPKYLG